MEWTRELRCKPYADWGAKTLLDLQAQAAGSDYKLGYHIMPTSGLLNDPNGFSYYNGYWHVFYQSYPFGPVHGLKSWNHMRSKDLVHWENLGLGLNPDFEYDKNGAYSGSALQIGDKLFIMYNGNSRDENWVRHPYQLGAWMDENNRIEKLPEPLITQPDHVTEHFRDPQIIKHKDEYYAIIGAQDAAQKDGRISIYRSKDLKNFEDLGYLHFTDENMGYMIECPSLVFINDKPVLIFCPQGMDKNICPYDNIYPNNYVIGDSVKLDAGRFEASDKTVRNLDEGFDVYASQAFNAPDGKAYLISWTGLPEIEYPTDKENWAHCLSQVKELSLTDKGELIQRPVKTMADLRYDGLPLTQEQGMDHIQNLVSDTGSQYELKLTLDANQKGILHLEKNGSNNQSLKLVFDTEEGSLTLDRGNSGKVFATEFGTTRTTSVAKNAPLDLDVFIDNSLCEIFINGGKQTMTARFFPEKGQKSIAIESQSDVKYRGTFWKMQSI